jgi:hypothetical protein
LKKKSAGVLQLDAEVLDLLAEARFGVVEQGAEVVEFGPQQAVALGEPVFFIGHAQLGVSVQEAREGLGDDEGALALVGGVGDGFVEVDAGGHGRAGAAWEVCCTVSLGVRAALGLRSGLGCER